MPQGKTPLLACCLFIVPAVALGQNPASKADAIPAVSVKSFGPDNVIGHLGHPLGTVVRVTGVCVDGRTTRRLADAGQTLLQIETVNGKRLERSFVFQFHRAAEGIAKPAVGQRFDYYVHEFGSFDGVVELPKSLGIQEVPVAHDGFYYRPEIAIHKSNSPQ